MSFIARYVCTYEEFDRISTVRQNGSDKTVTKDNTNNNIQIYKMGNVQNGTNTIYKIDNLVC